MPNYTSNYNLTKPLQNELYDIDIQNGNMDILDTNLKSVSNVANYAKSKSDTNADNLKKLKEFEKQPFESTGDFVTIQNFEGIPLSCVTTVEPIQSGSGDPSPSNIRPITGWTGVTLTRCGKNLINPKIDTDNYYATYASTNADGSITVSNESSSKVYPVTVWTRLPSGTYTAKFTRISGSNPTQVFLQCNDTADYSSNIADPGVKTFTLSEETQVRVMVVAETSESYTASIQIEQGSAATAYEPYQGDAYTADFGQTVYGGTMDWNTGVLTATHGQIAAYAGESLPGAWISDRDVYADGAMPTTGAQVVYKLATPYAIQLAPNEILALAGMNNIWCNAGETTVSGRTDILWLANDTQRKLANVNRNIMVTSTGTFSVGATIKLNDTLMYRNPVFIDMEHTVASGRVSGDDGSKVMSVSVVNSYNSGLAIKYVTFGVSDDGLTLTINAIRNITLTSSGIAVSDSSSVSINGVRIITG